MNLPQIAVVIPTLASPPSLARVLESLSKQTHPPIEVVVVAQHEPAAAQLAVASHYPNARIVHSEVGLSKARNAGIRALVSNWDAVALPDDDVIYDPGTFEVAARLLNEGIDGLCGRVRPENPLRGLRIAFRQEEVVLDSSNVWNTTIEAGYILGRQLLDKTGLYDESLGLGARSPWQSGEGTDLLLRALDAGFVIRYSPEVSMQEADSVVVYESSAASRRRRLRAYARGTGRVYRLRYGPKGHFYLLFKSVGRVVLRGAVSGGRSFRSDMTVLVGRFEGLRGQVFNG